MGTTHEIIFYFGSHPFLIHQRALLPSQCADIINSKLSQANDSIPGLPFNLLPVFCGEIDLEISPQSDLVGCGSPLQIVMAVWRTFSKFEASQTAISVGTGLPYFTQKVQIPKKCSKRPLPFEDITLRLFLMNMKGLKRHGNMAVVTVLLSDSYPAFFLPIATTSNKKF